MDQCTHCTVRGDIATCTTTTCGYHEMWLVGELNSRIKRLENALEDARLFAVFVESLGRSEREIYKQELKSSADSSLTRIDMALNP